MNSVDPFLFREFDEQTYNCAHFAREVWAELTGEDLALRLGRVLIDASDTRRITSSIVRSFVRLSCAQNPCLAIMQRPRSAPHIGVYLRGRILHLHWQGVEFQPPDVASRGFKTVTYFK